MYSRILVPIDNSEHSQAAQGLAIQIGRAFGSTLVGFHVYAAQLHDSRFQQMETGLPPKYQETGELERQRGIHDSLITRGLRLISDSYLEAFQKQCQEAEVACQSKTVEGRNFVEVLREIESEPYDLVVLGAQGLGAVPGEALGSVCQRVVRRARVDVLVARGGQLPGSTMLAAVDGSPQALAGVERALALTRALEGTAEAVACFDPFFHRAAFQSIAGVLSEEASQLFRFREQERLHDQIIDGGLAQIYRGHLEAARSLAEEKGMDLKTTLLEGKAYPSILSHIQRQPPSLLVVGRWGAQASEGMDIGSTAENLVRLAPCPVLVVAGEKAATKPKSSGAPALPWTPEAEAKLSRVPPFAQGLARQVIEDYARAQGLPQITPEVMDRARDARGL